MKYIKKINEFNSEKINEEWFPYDIFFTPKDKSSSSYLEFEGEYLKEITGENRNIDIVLDQIEKICNDPLSVNELFEAHIFAKPNLHDRKKSKKEITRKVKGFLIQRKKGQRRLISERLSNLGKIEEIEYWGSCIKLDLNEPIELTFPLNYSIK